MDPAAAMTITYDDKSIMTGLNPMDPRLSWDNHYVPEGT
jgi:hypothetical protein